MCFNMSELTILQRKLIERHEFEATIKDLHITINSYEDVIKQALIAESEHKRQKELYAKKDSLYHIMEGEYNQSLDRCNEQVEKMKLKPVKYGIVGFFLGYIVKSVASK